MKIGIDVGGSHIGIGIVNNKNELIDKIEYNWNSEEKETKEKLCYYTKIYSKKTIEELLYKNNINMKEIEVIGIGFPSSGVRENKIYLKGKEIDIAKDLREYFNTEVRVQNDVKCSGKYVKQLGELKEYNHALFLTLGTGIGGAYFYHDELVVPNQYAGFEIGHMIIEKNGRACRCGNKGCFETYASMKAFRKEIKILFHKEHVNSQFVLEVVDKKEKEEEVNKIIDEYLENLSLGLSNLINIFEPDAICIGGSFSHYESIFIEKLMIKIKQYFPDREIPAILVTKAANDAGIIGATL